MIAELKDIINELLYITKFIIYDGHKKKEVKEHRKNVQKLHTKLDKGEISSCLETEIDDIV